MINWQRRCRFCIYWEQCKQTTFSSQFAWNYEKTPLKKWSACTALSIVGFVFELYLDFPSIIWRYRPFKILFVYWMNLSRYLHSLFGLSKKCTFQQWRAKKMYAQKIHIISMFYFQMGKSVITPTLKMQKDQISLISSKKMVLKIMLFAGTHQLRDFMKSFILIRLKWMINYPKKSLFQILSTKFPCRQSLFPIVWHLPGIRECLYLSLILKIIWNYVKSILWT